VSTADALVYVVGAMVVLWGLAHIAPTKTVADSFGDISVDNRRILVMEWIAEGMTHIANGVLVILVAAVEGSAGSTAHLVYRVVAGFLIALAVLTTFTGARTPQIWFKACPFVLTVAAGFLLSAGAL